MNVTYGAGRPGGCLQAGGWGKCSCQLLVDHRGRHLPGRHHAAARTERLLAARGRPHWLRHPAICPRPRPGHLGAAVSPGQGTGAGPAQGPGDLRDSNLASARVIEKAGGVLEDVRETELGLTRRYWITPW